MEYSFRNKIKIFALPAWRSFSLANPILATKIIYRKHFGLSLNLKKPKRFTEKLQWLKLYKYSHNPLITQCADKYAVRKYVIEHKCGHLLNELLGCWNSVDDIPWDSLPQKFALKCTHGCHFNIICKDKSKLDIEAVKKQLSKWMSSRYESGAVELIYDDVKPRIICEKYIDSLAGDYPIDYKFFCSYGETKMIYVLTGRTDHSSFIDYFTPDWKWIPVRNGVHPNAGVHKIDRPEKLNEMMDYAKKLAADFPFCRVDFYCENGKVMFGELTFLPTGGLMHFMPNSYDLKFGKLFPIEKEIKQINN